MQSVDFVDEVGRRWAYAACFVILTFEITELVMGTGVFFGLPIHDEGWMDKYGWVKTFINLLEATGLCLVYYPFLACIDHRHSIAANIMGLIYLVPWIKDYSLRVYKFLSQRPQSTFIIPTEIPICISLCVIGSSYLLDLVRNIRRKRKHCCKQTIAETNSSNANLLKRGYVVSHHLKYVANLFNKRKQDETKLPAEVRLCPVKTLMKPLIYDQIFGFRYSTRLVCCMTVCVTVVVQFSISFAYLVEAVYNTDLCDMEHIPYIGRLLCSKFFQEKWLLYVALALTNLCIICFLFNTLITYRRRWHQLLRGDHSWHVYGSKIALPKNALVSGLKYAGFQVVYTLWGWTVLFFFFGVVLVLVRSLIPNSEGRSRGGNEVMRFILRNWSTVVLGIFIIPLIQRLICGFLFLQGKGSVLAIDNRRLYNAASYYFFILNVVVGFFYCLLRIIIPLVLAVLYLSRLDQPLFMKGYEHYDPGYASFVSMLLVDLNHNHPVLKAFVELMLQVRDQQQQQQEEPLTAAAAEKRRRSKLIRNRWWKTVTLANNPALVLKFLEQRLKDELKKAEEAVQLPSAVNGDFHSIEMIQPLFGKYETGTSLQALVQSLHSQIDLMAEKEEQKPDC